MSTSLSRRQTQISAVNEQSVDPKDTPHLRKTRDLSPKVCDYGTNLTNRDCAYTYVMPHDALN